jgi:hypothetical protein
MHLQSPLQAAASPRLLLEALPKLAHFIYKNVFLLLQKGKAQPCPKAVFINKSYAEVGVV